jgi:hypothetical protein
MIQTTGVVNHQTDKANLGRGKTLNDIVGEETFSEILSSEGCDNFVNYIGWLGFINDPNMIILSSKHHFYYDPEELRNINTIINLKELNQIKQIRNFLDTVSQSMQRNSNFIGYFTDNKQYINSKSNVNSSVLKAKDLLSENQFLSVAFNLIFSRINKYMSKKYVRLLLEENRFKVLDMTDLNGFTYFHAQVA